MRRLALPCLAALALAGCGPSNRGLSSVNQPVVTRSEEVLDLSLVGPALATGETQRLADWFADHALRYGDRVWVEAGHIPAPAHDAVARVAASYGLLLWRPRAGAAEVPAGRLRVVLGRSTAAVPNCPNWSRASQPEFGGSTMSNYGCATNSNLAAMIADPEDLVQGAAVDGTGDPRAIQRALKAYREQEPTGKEGLPGGTTSVSVVKGGN